MNLYYTHPVQVRYWDLESKNYKGGIVYQDYLISGVDGQVIPLNELFQNCQECGFEPDDVVIELAWLDLNQEILGE